MYSSFKNTSCCCLLLQEQELAQKKLLFTLPSPGGDLSGFLAQLEEHFSELLKPGALDALKNVMREEEEGRRVEEVEKERMIGAPTGNRLSLKSLQQQKETASRPIEASRVCTSI